MSSDKCEHGVEREFDACFQCRIAALEAENERLKRQLARIANAYHTHLDYAGPMFGASAMSALDTIGSLLSEGNEATKGNGT